MTALTADRRIHNLTFKGEYTQDADVAAATQIYHGGGVCFDASGHLVPAADTAALRTAGQALKNVDNTAGAAGDLTARILKAGLCGFRTSGGNAVTIDDIDKPVYWLDDNTVVRAAGTTNRNVAGRLHSISDSGVWFYVKMLDQAAAVDAKSAVAIYDHVDDLGVTALIPAAGVDRAVHVVAKITETLAGTTTTPIFDVGYATDDDAIITALNAGAAGDVHLGVGTLPAGESLDVTVVNGTGGAEAGKLQVSAIVVPI